MPEKSPRHVKWGRERFSSHHNALRIWGARGKIAPVPILYCGHGCSLPADLSRQPRDHPARSAGARGDAAVADRPLRQRWQHHARTRPRGPGGGGVGPRDVCGCDRRHGQRDRLHRRRDREQQPRAAGVSTPLEESCESGGWQRPRRDRGDRARCRPRSYRASGTAGCGGHAAGSRAAGRRGDFRRRSSGRHSARCTRGRAAARHVSCVGDARQQRDRRGAGHPRDR